MAILQQPGQRRLAAVTVTALFVLPVGVQHVWAAESTDHIRSEPVRASSDHSAPARKVPPGDKHRRNPGGAGGFAYEIKNIIRTQSEELCARYGSASDCIEEAEICLTIRDEDDDIIRLCLNTEPGDKQREKPQKSRLKR